MPNNSQDIRGPLVDALAQSPILRFLGKQDGRGRELRQMLERGEVHHFAKDESIITQGDESDAMYVLASGTVQILVDGKQVCVMDQPGEVFGEFGALTGEHRSASVVAQQDVTCFSVSAHFTAPKALENGGVFHQLLQQAFIKILTGRLRHSNEELVGLREALRRAENQVAMLRIDNDTLNQQLDEARKVDKESFHGPRGSEKG